MKRILLIAGLAFSLAALSGCGQQPDKNDIINAQAKQIAALKEQNADLQQGCSVPAVQQGAQADAPVAQVSGPPVVTSATAPVYVQQPTVIHERDGTGDLVTGMMLGHMLSGGSGGGGNSHTTTHVVNNYHQPAPPAAARRSWFSSSRTSAFTSKPVVRRSAFSATPSKSFSSSRSSFRSRR